MSRKRSSRRPEILGGGWTSSRSNRLRSRGSPIPTTRKCRRPLPTIPAAEALSPVPQWPDNRLLVPAEGTGYLDLLEYWRRDQEAKKRAAGLKVPDDEPEYWQRPDNGQARRHRPAPAGNARPTADLAGRPARAT